ncbi:MAG: cupredoxin domain-containing protein [Burkholderiales bacterium]
MKSLLLIATLAMVTLSTGAIAHGEKPHARKFSALQLSEEHAFGKAGDPKKVSRTITFNMSDNMRFDPSLITVKQGETIRFVAKNNGRIMHELVIGTMKELKAHAEQMKKFPGMEHDDPYMAHVAPGKTEEIIWQFTKAGDFDFACLIAGHFEAGMVGKIKVAAR